MAKVIELMSLRQKHNPLPQSEDDTDTRPESRRFGGWKGTLYLGSIGAFTVLILNLVMVSWASTRKSKEGSSVLYAGACDRTKQMSSGIHLLINILSTALLSASNFAMQCLSAPTRADVDRAHAKKKWLDVGVPSVRNLLRIPRVRMLLWLGLVVSSVPLHLFYNSTIYSTISANGYDVFVGNSSFTNLNPSDVMTIYDEDLKLKWDGDLDVSAVRMLESAQAGNLTRMPPEECIAAYGTSWQSKHGSVVLISSEFNGSMSAIHLADRQLAPRAGDSWEDPFGWICSDKASMPSLDYRCQSQIAMVKSNAERYWIVKGYKVDHCLVETTTEHCTLEYSLALAIVVIASNLLKILLIGMAIFALRTNPILTVGDAIASFLHVPDPATSGRCLLTRKMVIAQQKQSMCFSGYQQPSQQAESEPHELSRYNAVRLRRWSSVSKLRWAFSLVTYTSSLAVALGLLLNGLHHISSPTDGIWTSGFASIDTRTMIETFRWPSALIPNSLIANIPHLIFSLLYFTTNSILTTLSLSGEWSSFSTHRKGLRVSTPPHGHQRSTYFLSLPYRYSIPLIALSALLHWLLSQSIYLVRVLARDSFGKRFESRDTTTIGYSPPAIVTGLCVGLLLPVGVLGMGSRRFASGMPVAGSCSLAIAAGCHPVSRKGGNDKEGEGLGVEYQRVKWGVELYEVEVEDDSGETGGKVEVGHCSFSYRTVERPADGAVYS